MINILVIDDDEAVLDNISLVIKSVGYRITKASNGEEGIKKFDQSVFDVVITDLFMPLKDGNEVARYIRDAGKNIPIIGITGMPEHIDPAFFDKVLKKPFSLKELIAYLKEIADTKT